MRELDDTSRFCPQVLAFSEPRSYRASERGNRGEQRRVLPFKECANKRNEPAMMLDLCARRVDGIVDAMLW